MVYVGIWLLGMKLFDLEPVTSAQVTGGILAVHIIIKIIGEMDFPGNSAHGGLSDINRPFNFGHQGFPPARADDDDDWNEMFAKDQADEEAAQAARADHEYWIWENPHLEALERDGKD